jgi:nitroreductase
MNGIIFFKSQVPEKLSEFYIGRLGCELWSKQEDCIILKGGNLLFGFCSRPTSETEGLLTFFYENKEDIDRLYGDLKEYTDSPPVSDGKYQIYRFYARDPEGRKIEFQHFTSPVDRLLSGAELLLTRRSVRDFRENAVPEKVLSRILEISRFAPTSRNTQGYYFRIIKEREILNWLSETRGTSTAPIGRAPNAVAICSDPEISKRHVQDACIAAYHFMLAAWYHGVGTCWIAAMDQENIKEMLDIPQNHYIATITPLGFPKRLPIEAPRRYELSWFLRPR